MLDPTPGTGDLELKMDDCFTHKTALPQNIQIFYSQHRGVLPNSNFFPQTFLTFILFEKY